MGKAWARHACALGIPHHREIRHSSRNPHATHAAPVLARSDRSIGPHGIHQEWAMITDPGVSYPRARETREVDGSGVSKPHRVTGVDPSSEIRGGALTRRSPRGR